MTHLPKPPFTTRSADRSRGRVWRAIKLLGDALDGTEDATVRWRLLEAEEAAILAETRILELENRLEEMRRRSRAYAGSVETIPLGTSLIAGEFGEVFI